MHVELPVGAFIAAGLVLVPLPWHWRARNVATLSIIAWLFVANLIFGINSIIWASNVDIVVPVWCDIVTKIQIGGNMGIPASCLCLCMHLERIASVRHVRTNQSDKQRRMILDGLLCWGLPVIYMALHYIVQGHRFDIVENFGCRPTTYISVPGILIIWVLPLIVIVLTLIFAGFSLVHFFRRRITFARHLQNSNSALTTSRYFRLMLMAVVQMFWGALVTGLNTWFACMGGLRPWTGWADVHFNFSRIALFPSILIPESALRWTFILWWTLPITSVFFFAFFSFGEDAVKEYAACIRWVRTVVLRRKVSKIGDFTGYSSSSHIRQPHVFGSLSKFTHVNNDPSVLPSKSKFEFDHSLANESFADVSMYHPPSSEISFVLTPADSSFASSPSTKSSFRVSPQLSSLKPPTYSPDAHNMT